MSNGHPGRSPCGHARSRRFVAPRPIATGGFPLPASLAEAGYERGHLIAHATGGGLDANVFAQARHINRGWSPDGRRYRQLERLAAANPGRAIFNRLIYGDDTDVPDLTELAVAVGGQAHHGIFDNRRSTWT
jgi:hypothetical protein